MTTTAVNKTSGENTSLTFSFNTPPITTVTGRLYVLGTTNVHYPESVNCEILRINVRGGVTWTRALITDFNGYPAEVWYGYCVAGSTGVSFGITYKTQPSSICSRLYSIDEFSGTESTGIIVQTAWGEVFNMPSLEGNLNAFAKPSNATYELCLNSAASTPTITVEGGYNVLGDPAPSTSNIKLTTGYLGAPDVTPSFSATGDTATLHIIAMEINDNGISIGIKNSLMMMGCGT